MYEYPESYKRLQIFQFSTYIFSADITPEMPKLCRVTKVKVFFLALVYVFNFNLFEFSATILEKTGLFSKFVEVVNKSHVEWRMILCFQITVLSKTFLLFRFDKN